MKLIEVENLVRTFSADGVETPALRGVSFGIARGELVAIMGASGSGKSTLLHILGLLDRQTDGTYHLDGKNVAELSDLELARLRNQHIGFVFQSFNLLGRTSVYDNILLPLLYSQRPEAEWRDRVLAAIEEVKLSHRIHHVPSQLSGGEKQRVAIARALINEPDVIFADEPTGNLDSKAGGSIIALLQELNETKGHTIVLITHETYIAEHARRTIHFRDGLIESDRLTAQSLKSEHFSK